MLATSANEQSTANEVLFERLVLTCNILFLLITGHKFDTTSRIVAHTLTAWI